VLTEFILYVADPYRAREFYERILGLSPSLDVPGMTEFDLAPGVKLGLMPETGIAKILSSALPHPATASGVPRCELYLKYGKVSDYYERALEAGARIVSPPQVRDWGDEVAYVADPDGHVIAFAASAEAD
jgi:catechol 2,3-dioxygenase-like lactoylglutathione lyase family enzyme